MVRERLSRGSRLTGPGAALIFICFFLPWISVSCEGQTIGNLSGYELASGGPGINSRPELYLVVVAGLLSLTVLAYTYQRGYMDNTSAGAQFALAIIGFLPILLVYLNVRPEASVSGVTVKTQIGLWGTVLGILVVAIGGILDLLETRQEEFASWTPEPLLPTERATPPPPPPERRPTPEPQPARKFDPTRFMGEPPPVTAWLVQKSGNRAGKQYSLAQARNVIGRDATRCDVVLDNDTISGEHAAVLYENSRFVLYDLASTNGTFLNQRRVQRQSMLDDDVVRLGEVTLVFKSA